MTVNQEVKGTLARLLATENLTVEHRKVTTASFDVNSRVLVLPIWKTASNTVYDLLVGHEVGHALYTPNTDHEADRGFVNVLEDARIEKMMKRTYPGLRKSFYDGYTELNDQDFFGVNEEDLTKIPFIDRINLWFKGNADIEFSAEEQVWVDRTANTETFDEVVQLAIELYGRAEKIEDEKESEEASDDQMEMPDLSGMDIEWDNTPSDPNKQQEQQQQQTQPSAEKTPPIGGKNAPSPTPLDRKFDETESLTDEAFAQALETLIDDNCKEWKYLTLPEVNVDDYIIGHKEIQDDLAEHFYYPKQEHVVTDDERCRFLEYMEQQKDYMEKRFFTFKKEANKSVNYLIKQFEMKKSADNYKRQATAKTGVINTNALYKYRLTDDIFKRITTVPDGKNHGLIFHVDWSGSMTHVLLDTIKQTYNLVWFCRKAGIPFRVLAFQDAFSRGRGNNIGKFKAGNLYINDSFKMLELLSSRQNAKSLEESMKLVFMQVFAMGGYRVNASQKYQLGGTPLAEAVLCTRQLVNRMKKEESVQKVNVICLTDGESNPMSYVEDSSDSDYIPSWYDESNDNLVTRSLAHQNSYVFFLRDPKTGYTKKIGTHAYHTTKEIVSFFREITDYNWIGIRLCSKSDLGRTLRYNEIDTRGMDIDKVWKKEKHFSISNQMGFSEQLYIPDRNIGEGSEEIDVKAKGEVATRAELGRAFKKHMSSKMTNKTVLNKFIEQIA